MNETREPISPLLKGLGIGESAVFPVERLGAVRSKASELGLQLGRKFQSHASRKDRTITVTRIR